MRDFFKAIILTILINFFLSIFFLLSFHFLVLILFMGDKKVFSTRLEDDLLKKLKHLAIDKDESLGNLLEEAIQDLLKKYEKQESKPKK